jgi:hypothetical protein
MKQGNNTPARKPIPAKKKSISNVSMALSLKGGWGWVMEEKNGSTGKKLTADFK